MIKENKIAFLAIAAWTLMLIAAANGWIDPNTRAVSVVAEGAACDGVTDDTTAINNAISKIESLNPNGGGKLIFPSVDNSLGCLVTGNGINLTNTNGIHVEGQSSGQPTASGPNAATIIGETANKPVIDATGANDLTIDNLTIRAGGSNAPCIGILQARSTSSGHTFAQNQTLRNVWIYLGDNNACFSGAGNIGAYNYGAEITLYDNVNIYADNPLWWTPTNTQIAAASGYTTIETGSQSMTAQTLVGGSLQSDIGSPITAGDSSKTGYVGSVQINNTYMTTFGGSTTKYAILADVPLGQWRWWGPEETLTRAVDFITGVSWQLDMHPQVASAGNSDLIFELAGNASSNTGIQESNLCPSFAGALGTNPTATVVDDNGGTNTAGVQSSTICLPHLAKLSLHGSSAGDRIYSPDTSPTVSVGTGAELHFAGNVFTNQLGTVTGNPAAEIGPSVATGNLYSITVSGGTLSTNKIIRCVFDGTYFNNSGSPDTPAFEVLYNGSGSQCGGGLSVAAGNFNRPFHIVADISASAATNKQAIVGMCNLGSTNPATTSDALNITSINNTSIDSTANQTLVLFVSQGNNAAINSQLYYGACTLVN